MHFLPPVNTSFILFSYSFFPSRTLPNPSSPLPTSNPQLRPIFYQATPLCLTAPACSDCVADTAGRSVFIGVIGGSPSSPPSVVRRSYPLVSPLPHPHPLSGAAIRWTSPLPHPHPLSGVVIRWTSPLFPFAGRLCHSRCTFFYPWSGKSISGFLSSSPSVVRRSHPLDIPSSTDASQHPSQFASIRGFFSALERKHQVLHIPQAFGLAFAGR